MDLTDGLLGLKFLFLGEGEIPPPTPGVDPTPSDPYLCGDAPSSEDSLDEDLFDIITQDMWFTTEEIGVSWPTFYSYDFHRDGSFHIWWFSDLPELNLEGTWNFERFGENDGNIILSTGWVISFRFDPVTQTLNIHSYSSVLPLRPCNADPRGCGADAERICPECTRASLPEVPTPERCLALRANRWKLAQDFDPYPYAEEYLFDLTSHTPNYLSAGCSYSLRWSCYDGTVYAEIPDDGCEFARATRGSFIGNPDRDYPLLSWMTYTHLAEVDGRWKFLAAPLDGVDSLAIVRSNVYRPLRSELTERFFYAVLPRPTMSGTSLLVGRYEPPLRSAATRIRWALHNHNATFRPASEFRFRVQDAQATNERPEVTGEFRLLATFATPDLFSGDQFEFETTVELSTEEATFAILVSLNDYRPHTFFVTD